jgi:ubiquinone/menaquinone biosynthesis C-methylase UbiE
MRLPKFIHQIVWNIFIQRHIDPYLTSIRLPPLVGRLFNKGTRNEFITIGNEFYTYLRDLTNLKPNESILDVGCGRGRIALPLVRYLSKDGKYFGFDINQEEINWCRRYIERKFRNFHFNYVDIYNQLYNPTGKYLASTFKFPYPSNSFDKVLLASIFTHLTIVDMKHYFEEIARVLKPSGKSLITHFVLNAESVALISRQMSFHEFEEKDNISMILKGKLLEDGVAYDEKTIKKLYLDNHLSVEKIYYGSWCGRKDYLSFQDIIIANKL